MLSYVYDICTVVAHLRVSHAHKHSVRVHQSRTKISGTFWFLAKPRLRRTVVAFIPVIVSTFFLYDHLQCMFGLKHGSTSQSTFASNYRASSPSNYCI